MKPILLKIKGLNSFEEEQEIDFEPLSRYGFFGIFGPTGSGKSSIIDAVTLALYDKISRFDGSPRSKQFININTGFTYVYFEFGLQNKIYVVERQYKLKKGSIENTLARLYLKQDFENKVIEEKSKRVNTKIIEILGINYDDFKRAIVLPQGKFSDFLLLKNDDRRKMLERIFSLEKYGESFYKTFNKSLNEYNNLLQNITYKLESFQNVSEGQIKIYENELAQKNIKIKQLNKKQILNSDLYTDLKEIKKNSDELNLYYKSKNELLSKQDYIKQIEQKIIVAKNARSIKPLIEKNNNLKKIISEKNFQYKNLTENFKSCTDKESLLKSEYEKLKIDRDEKIPYLEKYCNELKLIIEILSNIKALEKERDALRNLFAEKKQIYENNRNTLEKLKASQKNFRDELKQISEQKEKLYFPTELRENVSRGVKLTDELISLERELESLSIKKNNIEKEIIFYTDEALRLDGDLKHEKQILDSIVSETEKINKTDIHEISELGGEIISLTEDFKQKEKSLQIKNETLKNIESAKIEISEYEELKTHYNLDDLYNQLNEINSDISQFEKERAISLISAQLKHGDSCPICGSVIDVPVYQEIPENILSQLSEQKNNLEKQIKSFENELSKLSIKHEIKSNQLQDLNTHLAEINIDDSAVKGSEANLKALTELYDKKKKEFESNKILSEKLASSKEASTKRINSFEISKNTSTTNIENKTGLLNEINKNIFEINQKIIAKKSAISQIPIQEDFFNLSKKISEADKTVNKLYLKEKNLNLEIDNLEKQILDCEKQKSEITIEFESVKEQGIEKNTLIRTQTDSLERLPKTDNPKEQLLSAENEIKSVIYKENKIKSDIDNVMEEKQRFLNDLTSLQAGIDALKSQLDEISAELTETLKAYNFKDEDEAEKARIPDINISEYEQEILEFKDAIKINAENIYRVETLLSGKDITDINERVLILENEIEELNSSFVKLKEDIALLNAKTTKMREDLVEVKQLNKEKLEAIHQIDLYKDLSDVFKGNKFVEYLAKKQLNYITAEASVRLKRMSKGRYAIELDDTFDNAEFVIRDDFNGGIRRSPHTLSGGETFIVSLCLALALSSRIQMNSKSPLEFFFLDEGFGTLDKKSLDDVIDCLMNLRSEKLIIGVISHSEELKDRVALKLLVEPPKQFERGSLVKLESL